MMRRTMLSALALVCTLTACGSDQVVGFKPPELSTLFWSLTSDIQAATVAVGGQQQLTVTPRDINGNALPGLPAPTFTSGDTTKVKVDSTGLVTGIGVTSGVPVVARLSADGLTYTDSMTVAVTAQSAVLGSLQIDTSQGTNLTLSSLTFLSVNATDQNSNPLSSLAISVRSLEPKIAQVHYYGLFGIQPSTLGQVHVVASTTSYGITKADTVLYSVQYSTHGSVYMFVQWPSNALVFSPTTVVIGTGGSVTWSNNGSSNASVIFDNGVDNVPGGNIASIPSFSSASRTFPTAGTYKYHDTESGSTGEIIVKDQPQY